MKHILYATTGIALALAIAGTAKPVMADVDAVATISKDKDINITENVYITKTVDIHVAVTFDLQGGAEAQALLNVTNAGNTVDGQAIPGSSESEPEYGLHYSADTANSVNNNRGVWGYNQDVGNMVNQGNVVSVAGIADQIEAFAQSQAHVDQANTNNRSRELEVLRSGGDPVSLENLADTDPASFDTNKEARLTRSVNGNAGIINVNQNAGNNNNQNNAVAAAVGIGAEFAMSEGDLGQENSHNTVQEVQTVKVSSIQGSVNGNNGIVNVNQSTGNMNNQGNVVSFSAITSGAFINTQSPIQ
ncbi:MAG: hypothetical protein R3D05_03990 [Dongiaceae bacterium]